MLGETQIPRGEFSSGLVNGPINHVDNEQHDHHFQGSDSGRFSRLVIDQWHDKMNFIPFPSDIGRRSAAGRLI